MTDQPTALDRIGASLMKAERLLAIAETPEQLEKIYEIVQPLGALITILEKRTDGDEPETEEHRMKFDADLWATVLDDKET